jgi:hypothetical protein
MTSAQKHSLPKNTITITLALNPTLPFNMQLVHALTAVLALGASAAPHAEPDTSSVQDVEARNYKCGRDAYWKDNCCQCRVEGMVYNKAWGGCNYP